VEDTISNDVRKIDLLVTRKIT